MSKYVKQFEIGKPFNPYNMFYGITIPNGIVEHPEISDQVKILMGRLFQYAGKNGKAYPFRETLAEECGWKKDKLDKVIRKAKDLGLIQTRPYVTDKTKNEHEAPSEYIFLYSAIYDEGKDAIIPLVKKSNGPVVKKSNGPVVKNDKHNKNHYTKKNHTENNLDKSKYSNSDESRDVKKRKLTKIVRPSKNNTSASKKKNNSAKGKYSYNSSDYMRYNTMTNAGCTKHRENTKAYFDSMDMLHSFFDSRCKNPIQCHIPEQYVDFDWTIEDVEEAFLFHLKHAQEEGQNVVKSIGKFIFSKGFNGNKSWSPLLVWHQKMNKTYSNQLTEEGTKLYKSMKHLDILDIKDLHGSVINKVAKELSEIEDKYVFVKNGQKISYGYESGIYTVMAKYIKDKMNNVDFELIYITKNGFIDEMISVATKRNILRKGKQSSSAKTGDIIERNGKKYIKTENGGFHLMKE